MKYFTVLVVICSAIHFSEQIEPNEEAMAKYQAMVQDCATKEGATEADVMEALSFEVPSTQSGKCLHACIGSSAGTIKNNHLDGATVVEIAKTEFGADGDQLKLVQDVSTKCAGVTDADRCEAAFKIVQCSDKAAKAAL